MQGDHPRGRDDEEPVITRQRPVALPVTGQMARSKEGDVEENPLRRKPVGEARSGGGALEPAKREPHRHRPNLVQGERQLRPAPASNPQTTCKTAVTAPVPNVRQRGRWYPPGRMPRKDAEARAERPSTLRPMRRSDTVRIKEERRASVRRSPFGCRTSRREPRGGEGSRRLVLTSTATEVRTVRTRPWSTP